MTGELIRVPQKSAELRRIIHLFLVIHKHQWRLYDRYLRQLWQQGKSNLTGEAAVNLKRLVGRSQELRQQIAENFKMSVKANTLRAEDIKFDSELRFVIEEMEAAMFRRIKELVARGGQTRTQALKDLQFNDIDRERFEQATVRLDSGQGSDVEGEGAFDEEGELAEAESKQKVKQTGSKVSKDASQASRVYSTQQVSAANYKLSGGKLVVALMAEGEAETETDRPKKISSQIDTKNYKHLEKHRQQINTRATAASKGKVSADVIAKIQESINKIEDNLNDYRQGNVIQDGNYSFDSRNVATGAREAKAGKNEFMGADNDADSLRNSQGSARRRSQDISAQRMSLNAEDSLEEAEKDHQKRDSFRHSLRGSVDSQGSKKNSIDSQSRGKVSSIMPQKPGEAARDSLEVQDRKIVSVGKQSLGASNLRNNGKSSALNMSRNNSVGSQSSSRRDSPGSKQSKSSVKDSRQEARKSHDSLRDLLKNSKDVRASAESDDQEARKVQNSVSKVSKSGAQTSLLKSNSRPMNDTIAFGKSGPENSFGNRSSGNGSNIVITDSNDRYLQEIAMSKNSKSKVSQQTSELIGVESVGRESGIRKVSAGQSKVQQSQAARKKSPSHQIDDRNQILFQQKIEETSSKNKGEINHIYNARLSKQQFKIGPGGQPVKIIKQSLDRGDSLRSSTDSKKSEGRQADSKDKNESVKLASQSSVKKALEKLNRKPSGSPGRTQSASANATTNTEMQNRLQAVHSMIYPKSTPFVEPELQKLNDELIKREINDSYAKVRRMEDEAEISRMESRATKIRKEIETLELAKSLTEYRQKSASKEQGITANDSFSKKTSAFQTGESQRADNSLANKKTLLGDQTLLEIDQKISNLREELERNEVQIQVKRSSLVGPTRVFGQTENGFQVLEQQLQNQQLSVKKSAEPVKKVSEQKVTSQVRTSTQKNEAENYESKEIIEYDSLVNKDNQLQEKSISFGPSTATVAQQSQTTVFKNQTQSKMSQGPTVVSQVAQKSIVSGVPQQQSKAQSTTINTFKTQPHFTSGDYRKIAEKHVQEIGLETQNQLRVSNGTLGRLIEHHIEDVAVDIYTHEKRSESREKTQTSQHDSTANVNNQAVSKMLSSQKQTITQAIPTAANSQITDLRAPTVVKTQTGTQVSKDTKVAPKIAQNQLIVPRNTTDQIDLSVNSQYEIHGSKRAYTVQEVNAKDIYDAGRKQTAPPAIAGTKELPPTIFEKTNDSRFTDETVSKSSSQGQKIDQTKTIHVVINPVEKVTNEQNKSLASGAQSLQRQQINSVAEKVLLNSASRENSENFGKSADQIQTLIANQSVSQRASLPSTEDRLLYLGSKIQPIDHDLTPSNASAALRTFENSLHSIHQPDGVAEHDSRDPGANAFKKVNFSEKGQQVIVETVKNSVDTITNKVSAAQAVTAPNPKVSTGMQSAVLAASEGASVGKRQQTDSPLTSHNTWNVNSIQRPELPAPIAKLSDQQAASGFALAPPGKGDFSEINESIHEGNLRAFGQNLHPMNDAKSFRRNELMEIDERQNITRLRDLAPLKVPGATGGRYNTIWVPFN